MEFADGHCHLQFDKFDGRVREIVEQAADAGVKKLICVGTTLADSQQAVELASNYDGVWATVGAHPHQASQFVKILDQSSILLRQASNLAKVVAIGEIGLDYFRNYSSKPDQQKALRAQIEAGLPTGLPFIFHVRDAFDDFWSIFDNYPDLRGVVHSFSAYQPQLDQILRRGLYVGLNGIMTFTGDSRQLEAAKRVPLDKLILETDAPYLTPKPYRGEVCQPKHVVDIAKFLAGLRQESIEELAKATTKNTTELFKLS